MDWGMPGSAELWRGALAGLPIALACGALCRLIPLRPAARHTLWVAALLGFLIPALLSPTTAVRVAGNLRESLPVSEIQSGFSRVAEFAGGAFDRFSNAFSRIFGNRQDCVSPDAAEAPIAASSPRGDDPAAQEPVQEAEPCSTPRIVLHSPPNEDPDQREAGQARKPPQRECANRSTPWLKDVPSINPPPPIYVDATEKSRGTEPAANDEIAGASDLAGSAIESDVLTSAGAELKAIAAEVKSPAETTTALSPATLIAQETIVVQEPNAVFLWIIAAGRLILNTARKIAELPAIPTSLWVGGLIALALWQVFRTWNFWRRVRKALPAPSVIRRAVELAAKDIGLARAPKTYLVDARVSPLIWCISKPVLILPQRLWAQLDKKGRHAILCHELAHLRRRDHWIAWIEQVVALLYWWNPLVWWIRRRIHDEADLACDAWVTWLMPENRRSYAEALLQTRQFTSSGGWTTPTAGMAAASGRASEFSRRLTMVMTRSDRPRRSMMGYALAASALSLGWAASPAWSCPDAKSKDKTAKKPAKAFIVNDKVSAPAAIAVTVSPDGTVHCADAVTAASPGCATVVAPAHGGACTATTSDQVGVHFHTAVPGGAAASPFGHGQALFTPVHDALTYSQPTPIAPIAPLKTTLSSPFAAFPPLAQTTPALAMLTTQNQGGNDGDGDVDKRLEKLEKQLAKIAEELKATREGQNRNRAPRALGPGGGRAPGAAVNIGPMGGGQWRTPVATAEGPVEIKQYAIESDGKLDALYNLMVRDDVPVRVRKDGDKIEVHGTASQQAVFKAFLDMINPDGAKAGSSSGGQSGSRGGAGAGGSGGGWRQSGARMRNRAIADVHGQLQARYGEALAKLNHGDVQKALREALSARELFGQAKGQVDAAMLSDHLRALSELAHVQMNDFTSKAGDFEKQAEELQQQAERLTEEAAEMIAKAAEAAAGQSGDAARQAERVQRDMERASRELERRARELEKQARKLEQKANELNNKRERVENDADELNGLIEELNESVDLEEVAIDDMDESIELPDIDVPDIDVPTPAEPATPPSAPSTPAPTSDAAPSTPPTPTAPKAEAPAVR